MIKYLLLSLLILNITIVPSLCEDKEEKWETPGDFAGGYFRFNDKKSCNISFLILILLHKL